MKHAAWGLVFAAAVLLGLAADACAADGRADEPPDGIMGEYDGTFTFKDGAVAKTRAAVIGEGDGAYRAVITAGEGGKTLRIELKGKADGKTVALAGDDWTGTLEGGKSLKAEGPLGKVDLAWTVRTSPTLGAKPPAGATVLLPFEEGKAANLDAWCAMNSQSAPWTILADGSVEVKGGNIRTKAALGDIRLHVEFRCPYMPVARGQGRGNSGVYLQSRYEVQVLDSFGLAPKDNECGGIYSVATPKSIESLPPGAWQTYDIDFRSPEVTDGKITRPAVLTVRHNGVLIHENVKADHVTTAGVGGPVESPAPLMLQDHGNAVRFRNIWLEPLKD